MAHQTNLHHGAAAAEPVCANDPNEAPTPVPLSAVQVSRPASRRFLWLGVGVVTVVACAALLVLVFRPGAARHAFAGADSGSRNASSGNDANSIPVNTVRPRKKTLERTLVQPGSIRPWAQVELYAKVSGYLKTIQPDLTPYLVADLVAQRLSVSGPAITCATQLAASAQLALWQAPQKDIGARVAAGEPLLEIATPERIQDIVEKETLLNQRQAELEAARTALATFEAVVQAARAQKIQAEADVRRWESEHTFRTKELKRLKELVQSRTITPEIADEKQYQVQAALAAWESSQAKVQTAQADLAVASSKLATARADIKVKQALVQVAEEELHRARILADYSHIYAPFDGVITYRGVDEGDFVQNATSGQARLLMTVTAIDRVKVVLQVPERDAPWVQVGTEATVVVDARTSWHFKGHVARTAGLLDPQTRTLQVEIDLENRDHKLLSDMYGSVTLTLQKIPDAQAIPATAVYSRLGENFILPVQDGIAHRQRVRIRYDDGKEVEVVKLIDGQEVPLDGSEELIVSNKGEIAEGQHVKTTLLSSP